jgi:hypothetical protein
MSSFQRRLVEAGDRFGLGDAAVTVIEGPGAAHVCHVVSSADGVAAAAVYDINDRSRIMTTRRTPRVAAAGTILILALTVAPMARARTIDCGPADVRCLISAIQEANVNGDRRNTIRLQGGTYTLTEIDNENAGPNGLPSITSALTIEASKAVTTEVTRAPGAANFRVFHIASGGRLTLRGVTVSNGMATGSPPGGGQGGALFNDHGVVTISDSAFAGNRAAGSGAGLFNSGGQVTITHSAFARNVAISGGAGGLFNAAGEVVIDDSLFDRNDANAAGGLMNLNGTMRITRSSLTRNTAPHEVGGLFIGGGTVSILDSTIAGNGADGSGGILVDGNGTLIVTDSAFVANTAAWTGIAAAILNRSGTVDVTNTTFAGNLLQAFLPGAIVIFNRARLTLTNSTFADNVPQLMRSDTAFSSVLASADGSTTILQNTNITHPADEHFVQDCDGSVISQGNNLIGDLVGCAISLLPGDLIGDAGLGTFTDDGTPGNGHFPLLATSQAIDAGSRAFCPKRDQISQPRGGKCDIGAIEFRHQHGKNIDDH